MGALLRTIVLSVILSIMMIGAVAATLGKPLLADARASARAPSRDSIFQSSDFPVEGEFLRKRVEFWVAIYSHYDTHEGVIHDSKYVDRVYQVLNFKKMRGSKSRILRRAEKKWRKILLSVHRKQGNIESLTPEERRVYDMFKDIEEPNKYLNAAHRKRLRFQQGLKRRFVEGIRASGHYLSVMEKIFEREGLPVELTRLPFVESSFNLRAQSKVGASGIWQFMPSTGRLFLTINQAVDERNDPVRATEAAARLLKLNYDSLGSWPLAVTAYNHGRKGLMRAVRLMGTTDLDSIIRNYRSRTFGFASSNFYAELVAAIEVERNSERYFGKVDRAEPIEYVEAEIPDYIALKELARFLELSPKELKRLNPGLRRTVFTGHQHVPAGYKIRLPYKGEGRKEATVNRFLAGYEMIPEIFKHDQPKARKRRELRSRRPAKTW